MTCRKLSCLIPPPIKLLCLFLCNISLEDTVDILIHFWYTGMYTTFWQYCRAVFCNRNQVFVTNVTYLTVEGSAIGICALWSIISIVRENFNNFYFRVAKGLKIFRMFIKIYQKPKSWSKLELVCRKIPWLSKSIPKYFLTDQFQVWPILSLQPVSNEPEPIG